MKLRILLFLLLTSSVFAQERIPPPPCSANGNTGAGGVIGNGGYLSGYFGTEIHFSIDLGTETAGSEFNDILVFYIATGKAGRTTIDNTVDDDADPYRIAISNSNAFGFGSTITFPADFEAAYAIAVDASSGGLYGIPNNGIVGSGDLIYIGSVNSTLSSNTQPGFEISFEASNILLEPGDEFMLVGVYVSPQGFTYDEGYGEGISPNTQGSDNITFTGLPSQSTCWNTLGTNDPELNTVIAYYFNDKLHINGLFDKVDIGVYDLVGRKILSQKHQIYGQKSITMPLKADEFRFIVIETRKGRKILKVIPR
ncbi:MAG: hypothetical protein HKO90_01665 [Flavobacteriaceae bacterium]|nr:hypothetical protein [Bacteroidia bacterium]NNK86966.1 hypothetical protein [Flavobacteriaceae bacterium]